MHSNRLKWLVNIHLFYLASCGGGCQNKSCKKLKLSFQPISKSATLLSFQTFLVFSLCDVTTNYIVRWSNMFSTYTGTSFSPLYDPFSDFIMSFREQSNICEIIKHNLSKEGAVEFLSSCVFLNIKKYSSSILDYSWQAVLYVKIHNCKKLQK